MGPTNLRTLAAYCYTEGVSCKEPSGLWPVVERVRQRLDKKLGKKGITLQWQETPEQCNLWLCFASVDRGNQFLRCALPLMGAASVSVRVALSAGGAAPDEFSLRGSASMRILGGFAAGMLRVCADRVAAKVAHTVRKWLSRHEREMLWGRTV
jgi:hypothetical protein